MKQILSVLFFGMIVIFLCNCNGAKRKEESKNWALHDFSVKKFDLDSSISIMIPNSWDSIGGLLSYSYEYKYYITLNSKEKGELLVQRLKFKNPLLQLSSLVEFYKHWVSSNPSYKNVRLLREDFPVIGSKKTGILFYSMLYKNEPVYLSKVFFINSDSSNTLIEVETRNSDTSISHKWNDHIVNSIRITK
jgi:hypothetical protein